MKIRYCAALLIAVMTLSLLTGCTAQTMSLPQIDQPENPSQLNREVMTEIPDESVPLAAIPTEPAATQPAETAPKLTAEEAKAIALEHAGFTAGQVRFIRIEPEFRDRIPHFDVEFEEGRWEYEYEIHAETGAVLSFEKDD